jgi:methylaspartate ammonia-lyase
MPSMRCGTDNRTKEGVTPITATIRHVLAVPAMGAYYFDDLTALQAQPLSVAERYTAAPVTPGYHQAREVAEAVSVGLVLDVPSISSGRDPSTGSGRDPSTGSGRDPSTGSGCRELIAWGDCVAVEFSGKAGRHPLFRAEEGLETIQRTVTPALRTRELSSFRELAAEVDVLVEEVETTQQLTDPARPGSATRAGARPGSATQAGASPGDETGEQPNKLSRRELFRLLRPSDPAAQQVTVQRPLHTAVRYGVSQALLAGLALARGMTMAEVVAEEYELPLPTDLVPIHAQCGADRHAGADKMIARRVASLPHTLVDNIPEHLGEDGQVLVEYTRWLRQRIPQLAGDEYRPTIHLDVHGALGQIYENNLGKILGYMVRLQKAVGPYPLRVESPLILDTREAQIEAMKTLRDYIRFRGMSVQLVADEWANTLEDIQAFIDAEAADMLQIKMPDLGSVHNSVEAVLACKAGGVGAFLGGSCAETDLSARVAVHVALATQPDLMMAKPGMGVDEGTTLVSNEMARTLAWIEVRHQAVA